MTDDAPHRPPRTGLTLPSALSRNEGVPGSSPAVGSPLHPGGSAHGDVLALAGDRVEHLGVRVGELRDAVALEQRRDLVEVDARLRQGVEVRAGAVEPVEDGGAVRGGPGVSRKASSVASGTVVTVLSPISSSM